MISLHLIVWSDIFRPILYTSCYIVRYRIRLIHYYIQSIIYNLYTAFDTDHGSIDGDDVVSRPRGIVMRSIIQQTAAY